MRIVVVAACPFPFPRGTPIRIARLSEGLARLGHDVHVVTYHLGAGTPADGVRVTRIPEVAAYRRTAPGPSWAKLLLLDPLLTARLRRVLREEEPDVVHAHHYEGLVAAHLARGRRGTPVVYDAHTTLVSELPHAGMLPGRGFKRALGATLDRRLVRLADAVTCVNESLRDRIAPYARPGAETAVVEGGVELDAFDPEAPDRRASTSRTLVFSGNLAAYQGIDELLRAFAAVARRAPDVRLLFVTSDEASLGPYEARAVELGVRDRIDHVRADFAELPALLAGSDVALHPRPPCAGTPIKLLNYMAAGLPIVSFEGSAKGLAHGDSAWLVPDGDVDAFAEATLTLLGDRPKARALGRAARLVAERHSWDASAERLEAHLRRLLDRR